MNRKKARSEPPEAAGDEPTFEEALARLEAIVTRLEDGEVPLEQSLDAYTEGTRLVRFCLGKLERAESVIKELAEGPDGFRLASTPLREELRDEEDAAP